MGDLVLSLNDRPFLYLGDMHDAMDLEGLKKRRIKYIVNCTEEVGKFFPWMEFIRLPIDDDPYVPILGYLDDIIEFIDEARKKGDGAVLVHCVAGVSRSATVVIAYLTHGGMRLDQAIEHVLSRRPRIHPNEGFFAQLATYSSSDMTYEDFKKIKYRDIDLSYDDDNWRC